MFKTQATFDGEYRKSVHCKPKRPNSSNFLDDLTGTVVLERSPKHTIELFVYQWMDGFPVNSICHYYMDLDWKLLGLKSQHLTAPVLLLKTSASCRVKKVIFCTPPDFKIDQKGIYVKGPSAAKVYEKLGLNREGSGSLLRILECYLGVCVFSMFVSKSFP